MADAVNKYLVGATSVDAVAPLCNGVKGIPLGASAALTIDAVVVTRALAVEGVEVELLVDPALVAVEIGAGSDLRSRPAS